MRINKSQINLNFSESDTVIECDNELTAGDFFAGGGGVSRVLYTTDNVKLKWVLNHDKVAIKTNIFHHKGVNHYWSDIFVQDEHELEPVDIIWASFECTQHSKAKGGAQKNIGSYMMGWELYRYIKFLQPLVLGIENVPEIKKWAPLDENGEPDKNRIGEEFERWKQAFIDLGYNYVEDIRNAADDGCPTRRVRYFSFFYRDGIDVTFPETTHNEFGTDGKEKWLPCRPHINLNDEGHSIFGRKYNEALPKQHRKLPCPNSLRRFAGGIKKQHPDFFKFLNSAEVKYFISTYYGGDQGKDRSQSLDKPINTIPTENRHALMTLEKVKFIQDHCHTDSYQGLDEPLRPQLTRQTKQIISLEHLICQVYGTLQSQSVDAPINTIPCRDVHQLVRLEKMQFIAHYFNSGGKPETQNQSLDQPLNSTTTSPKAALVTILDSFDIKSRFLTREELAGCSTFPRDYFSKPGLKLSHKAAVKMIGNAVPPEWARKLIDPQINSILQYKLSSKSA